MPKVRGFARRRPCHTASVVRRLDWFFRVAPGPPPCLAPSPAGDAGQALLRRCFPALCREGSSDCHYRQAGWSSADDSQQRRGHARDDNRWVATPGCFSEPWMASGPGEPWGRRQGGLLRVKHASAAAVCCSGRPRVCQGLAQAGVVGCGAGEGGLTGGGGGVLPRQR